METQSFDLREQRCPMALLLAKRACDTLNKGDELSFIISDDTSLRDIHRYFEHNGFLIKKDVVDGATLLYITKN